MMNNEIVIKPDLTAKQKEVLRLLFANNGISEILYGGGAGGGKSYLGCLFLIIGCLKYPNTRWLMGRAKLSALRQSTLNTFYEVAQKLNLKVGEHFTVNNQSNTINFTNGSQILLKDLFTYPSDPNFDSLGSIEITGAFVDEANQITEKAKNVLVSRIRYKLDENNLEPKILMTCNPSKNWVYNEYYKKHKDGTIEEYKSFIQSLVGDNKFISKHYVNNLNRLDEVSQARLLRGEWEYADNLSIFDYDSIVDTLNRFRKIDDRTYRHIMAVDVARLGKDATVIMIMNDEDTIVHIEEFSKYKVNETVDRVKELAKEHNIKFADIIIDSDGVGGGVADYISGSRSIVNNAKPFAGDNYQNLKTQLYFKLGEQINNGNLAVNNIKDAQEVKLTQELQILKRTKIDQDGKICMTSKDEVKKMIGRSPDYSDCLAYLMYFKCKSNTNNGPQIYSFNY